MQAVLAAHYRGKPVTKQSLSQWRRGGYAVWSRQQETLKLAKEMATTITSQPGLLPPPPALRSLGEGGSTKAEAPLSDPIAPWLTARYLLAVRKLAETNGVAHLDVKILHEFSRDLAALRRGDHCAARLKIDQERSERRSRSRAAVPQTGASQISPPPKTFCEIPFDAAEICYIIKS